MNPIVFLDLEETIIESFSDPVLCNVTKIRNFLEARDVTKIHMFSFAIYNDADRDTFDRFIRPNIEEALGVTVISCPTVVEMYKTDTNFTGTRFDIINPVMDYISLRGKKDAFINYVNAVFDYDVAILIDDMVPDLDISHRFNDYTIELWNINSLEKGV